MKTCLPRTRKTTTFEMLLEFAASSPEARRLLLALLKRDLARREEIQTERNRTGEN
jgi:hypothetical protein